MKKIVFLGVLLVLLVSSYTTSIAVQNTNTDISTGSASEAICGPYKQLFVQIDTEVSGKNTGRASGFIVGEEDDAIYIVTANHVIQNKIEPYAKKTEIKIHFFWDQSRTKNAEVLISNQKLDVALLRIDKKAESVTKRISWDGLTWCSEWKKEAPVWFIGWEDQSWHLSPAPGKLLDRTIDQPAWIDVFINTILPGNSGTPFITQDCGIVSMAIKDSMSQSVLSVDIAQIKRFVTSRRYPWNMHKKMGTQASSESAQDIEEDKEEKEAWYINAGMSYFLMDPNLPRDLVTHSTHPDDQSFMSGSPGSTVLEHIDMIFLNLEGGYILPLETGDHYRWELGFSVLLKVPVSEEGREEKQNENDIRPATEGSFIYTELSSSNLQPEIGLHLTYWQARGGNRFRSSITPGIYLGYWQMSFEKGWDRFGLDEAECRSDAKGLSISPQIAVTLDTSILHWTIFGAYRAIRFNYDSPSLDSSSASGFEFGASVGWKF